MMRLPVRSRSRPPSAAVGQARQQASLRLADPERAPSTSSGQAQASRKPPLAPLAPDHPPEQVETQQLEARQAASAFARRRRAGRWMSRRSQRSKGEGGPTLTAASYGVIL